ncbi:MAG: hypothetical protein M5U14_05160 [Acidimicrobiia bacterium]|nr:hypothetical protein [Acidimicrobiia bacterium]
MGESGDAVSFFDDVLARADEGRGDPVDLGDGLAYVPTDSIEGAIVDADGAVVPGASIGFGLLEIADGDAGLAALPAAWIGDATGETLATSRALAIFSTTRRADGATHLGFGDQFELDITFVDDVAPGDTVRQTTASGQALRLASEDATADDHGVFAARLAAGSAGLVTTVDDGVVIPELAVTESVAIEGSTRTQKAIKAGLGGLTIGAGVLAAGLVCLETVGLGCAVAVLFLAPASSSRPTRSARATTPAARARGSPGRAARAADATPRPAAVATASWSRASRSRHRPSTARHTVSSSAVRPAHRSWRRSPLSRRSPRATTVGATTVGGRRWWR